MGKQKAFLLMGLPPARASYDDRIEILNRALSEAVAEVVRLREQLAAVRRTGKRRRRLS